MNAVAKDVPADKPTSEVVKMQDGREVEFVGKRKLLKESIISDAGEVSVRLDFRNGETRTFVIPATLTAKFAAHGAEQKLGDETAGVDDVDDMVIGVDELIDRLNKGEWSQKRESSGLSGTSVLARALVEWSGRTPEQVKEFLKTKTGADKNALRSSTKVGKSGFSLVDIIKRIESEKQAKASKVDTDALLAAL